MPLMSLVQIPDLKLFELEPLEHKCSSCGVVLTVSNWQPCREKANRYECRSCYHARMEIYYENNLEALTRYKAQYYEDTKRGKSHSRGKTILPSYQEIRTKVFRLIAKSESPRCIYCGCDEMALLQINHKNGGGQQERKSTHTRTGFTFFDALIRGKRTTDDLEIVCGPDNILHYYKRKYPAIADKLKVIWVGE